MTMVAVGKFKDGAIVISDSRASYTNADKSIPNDSLQKIIPIGNVRVFCYAGSVSLATKLLRKLKELNAKNKDYQYLEGIVKKLPGLARFVFNSSTPKEQGMGLSIIIGGKLMTGEISFWKLSCPDFLTTAIKTHDVIGSGSIVKGYLDNEIHRIESLSSLKEKADALLHGLSAELSKHGIDSVGGMFQIVLVSDIGIQPFDYGYIDLDPEGIPNSMSMTMKKGVWIQNNFAKEEETAILSPDVLLSQSVRQRVTKEYTTETGPKKEKGWHLNYFMTCNGVKLMPDDIEFHGACVIGQSTKFPLKFKIVLAIGFWGSASAENIVISLESKGKKEVVCEIPFNINYFPEDIDLAKEIELIITEPGIVFLEAKIKNQIIGRRVLFFNKISEEYLQNMLKSHEATSKGMDEAKEGLVGQVDPIVEGGKPELVYSFLCQNYKNEGVVETFENQFWVAYWKQYPLPLACYIASAFRLSKGMHTLRVDLVDAASHKLVSNVTTTSLESRSSCLISPIHGKFVIHIPQPGYYYLNTYVDNIFTASTILVAETDRPRYSYSLLQGQAKEVTNGQLMLLSKRASQENPKKEL